MTTVNKILIHTLEADLKELQNLCNELQHNVEVSNTSWRFPSKRSSEIDLNEILATCSSSDLSNAYVNILEMTCDRNHYILNLFLKQINSIPAVSENFKLSRNIICPQANSFSAISHMIWERIKYLQDNLKDNVVDCTRLQTGATEKITTGKNFMNKLQTEDSQLEDGSKQFCDSCLATTGLIRKLTENLEKQCVENNVVSTIDKAREIIQKNIFEMTQWDAMQYWCDAILEDINSLLNKFHEVKIENQELRDDVECVEKKHTAMLKTKKQKIKLLEQKMNSLINTYQNVESNKNSTISNLESEVRKLRNVNLSLQEKEQLLKVVETEKKKLSVQVHKLMEELTHVKQQKEKNTNELTKICQQYSELKEEHEIQKIELKTYKTYTEKTIEEIKSNYEHTIHNITLKQKDSEQKHLISQEKLHEKINECDTLAEEIKNLKIKLQQTEEECTSITQIKAELEMVIKELKERQNELLRYPDESGSIYFKVSGNPIQDMEGQISANNTRILLLQDENKNLQGTLSKLRQINLMKQNVTKE